MSGGGDSIEVMAFLAAFARLKDWCDDAPETLGSFAAKDSSMRALCVKAYDAARPLREHERRTAEKFALPVNPAFQAAWRDYEERYETVLGTIWILDWFPELIDDVDTRPPSVDVRWTTADTTAQFEAGTVSDAINFAVESAWDEERWPGSDDYIDDIKSGIETWQRLTDDPGLDLRGVLRRHALVPFVLVPRAVAARTGNADRLSLLKNLQQAQQAFIYGAPFAAIAMMRSILEAALRDLYRVQGGELADRISNSAPVLPPGVTIAALHRLRRRANAILHLDLNLEKELPALNEAQLEKEIVSFLIILRTLIERAK
jgi:hypothetical protein